MPIKKSRIANKSRKFKKSRKNKLTRKSRKSRNYKKNRSRSISRSSSKSKKYNHHKGGASCDLVTINEPGFKVDSLGSMEGLSIDSSSAVIYRPNCTNSYSSQAMAP